MSNARYVMNQILTEGDTVWGHLTEVRATVEAQASHELQEAVTVSDVYGSLDEFAEIVSQVRLGLVGQAVSHTIRATAYLVGSLGILLVWILSGNLRVDSPNMLWAVPLALVVGLIIAMFIFILIIGPVAGVVAWNLNRQGRPIVGRNLLQTL